MYRPNCEYGLSSLLCHTVAEDGSLLVNHILGRAHLRLGSRWALFAQCFAQPATSIEVSRSFSFTTREVSMAMRAMRRAGILQCPGNGEEDHLRRAYAGRLPQPPGLEVPPLALLLPGAEAVDACSSVEPAPGTILLELDNDELLVGRVHRPPLHVSRALWEEAIADPAAGHHSAGAREFLTRKGVLGRPSGWDGLPPLADDAWVIEEPATDRFRQIAEPYASRQPALRSRCKVHLIGPCQVQSIAEALEWQAARRGIDLVANGWLEAGDMTGEADVVVLPAAQFGARLLDGIILGNLELAQRCLAAVIAETDRQVCLIDARYKGPIVLIAPRAPKLSGVPLSGPERACLERLFTEWHTRLLQLATQSAAQIHLLSEDAVGRTEAADGLTDEMVTSIRHHSPLATRNWVILKAGVTDRPLPVLATDEVTARPGCIDGAGSLGRAVLRLIEILFLANRIKQVIVDPAEMLWRLDGRNRADPRPLTVFADVESYVHAGIAEALCYLASRGVDVVMLSEEDDLSLRHALDTALRAFGQSRRDSTWRVMSCSDWGAAVRRLTQQRVSTGETLLIRAAASDGGLSAYPHIDDPQAVRSALLMEPRYFADAPREARSGPDVVAGVTPQPRSSITRADIRLVIERIVRTVSNWPAMHELPDNMRLVGLDSFAALNVAIEVETSLGVALDPSDFNVYGGLSIASLADAVLLASRRATPRKPTTEDPWFGMDEAEWVGSSFRDLLIVARSSRAWALRQRDPMRPWLEQTWSRAGLLGAASGLAALMLERGLKPGEPALVDLADPADRAVALTACLLIGVPACFSRAGAVGVSPAERLVELRPLLSDFAATAVVGAQSLEDDAGVTTIPFHRCPRLDPHGLASPDLSGAVSALLLSSSGSSGRPKVFRPSRRQLLTALWHAGHGLELASSDRIAGWLPHHHNFGLNLTVLLPLLTGVQTVLMSSSCWSQDPFSFLQLLSESRATVTFVPSSALATLSRLAERARRADIDLSALRLLVCSGERASPGPDGPHRRRPGRVRATAIGAHISIRDDRDHLDDLPGAGRPAAGPARFRCRRAAPSPWHRPVRSGRPRDISLFWKGAVLPSREDRLGRRKAGSGW